MSIVCYVSLFERGDKRIRKIACSVAIRVEWKKEGVRKNVIPPPPPATRVAHDRTCNFYSHVASDGHHPHQSSSASGAKVGHLS